MMAPPAPRQRDNSLLEILDERSSRRPRWIGGHDELPAARASALRTCIHAKTSTAVTHTRLSGLAGASLPPLAGVPCRSPAADPGPAHAGPVSGGGLCQPGPLCHQIRPSNRPACSVRRGFSGDERPHLCAREGRGSRHLHVLARRRIARGGSRSSPRVWIAILLR